MRDLIERLLDDPDAAAGVDLPGHLSRALTVAVRAQQHHPRMRAAHPDPKPRKRIVDQAAGRAKVALEGRCRGCGAPSPLTRAHLVPRSLGGDDVTANLIPLCGSGTTGCHGATENREPGWEKITARVRATLTDDEIAYVLGRKGDGFLDRYWPANGPDPA